MKKLMLLGLLFSSYGYASIDLTDGTYKYECSYSTPWDQQSGKSILVVVRGEVKDLSELKGKQEVVVDSGGQKVTLEVGNCRVEL